jgi:hypothetical protein
MEETQEQKEDWKERFRDLSEDEVDLLIALYDKYNGNLNQMILDKDCLFRSYGQLHTYAHKYGFEDKMIEIKTKRQKDVIDSLQDSKIRAIQNAQRLLSPKHRFVFTKTGLQLFDKEGKPLIVEDLPYYKEIKTAWDIIKTELGEPTTISKSNLNLDTQVESIEITIKRNETQTGSDTNI